MASRENAEGADNFLVVGPAGVGQRQFPRPSLEQPQLQPSLQSAHLLCHGRLGDAQLVGGGAKGQVPAGGLEGSKRI